MVFKNVLVAGGGTLGSQVAWQCAIQGFNVIVYDAFEEGIARAKSLHNDYALLFETRDVAKDKIEAAFKRITYTTDLEDAVKDADIVSESVPEDETIKREFYEKIGRLAPDKTVFTTNSSTTVPSQYAEYTGRPNKFLALHFANGIWDQNIAEIMKHPGTDESVFEQVVSFSEQMGMVPIRIRKEQSGYVLNSLLVPLLMAATDLLMNEVSVKEDIDKTWKISTKSEMGPVAIMDLIGLQTMYNVAALWGNKMNDKQMLGRAAFYKKYIDEGKLGMSSGEGFYKY